MILYYCSGCDKHHRRARVKIEWFGKFDLKDNMLVQIDELEYVRDDGCIIIGAPKCVGCESDMIAMEVDDCPHEWQVQADNARYCFLCGRIQEGRLVFE